MNVIKIVVDEKDSCDKCLFMNAQWTYYCILAKKNIAMPHINPSWCPLVVDDVCEWHETEVNEHGWRFWMTGCKIKYDSSVQITKGEFNFCPSCGKRIKYVEVE